MEPGLEASGLHLPQSCSPPFRARRIISQTSARCRCTPFPPPWISARPSFFSFSLFSLSSFFLSRFHRSHVLVRRRCRHHLLFPSLAAPLLGLRGGGRSAWFLSVQAPPRLYASTATVRDLMATNRAAIHQPYAWLYTQSSVLRSANLRNHWWGGARKRINQKGSVARKRNNFRRSPLKPTARTPWH
jgi:hypothetical protein